MSRDPQPIRRGLPGNAGQGSRPDCQVGQRASEVLLDARKLTNSMRRLRLALRACRRCPGAGACPLVQNFNNQLVAALREIAEEWHLGETL